MSDNNQIHPFDEAVKLELTSDYTYKGIIPQSYSNMVGPFGGIIAAVTLNSILRHKESQGEPISLTVNFTGRITYTPFVMKVRLMRNNRSNQHWFIELIQNSKVAITATTVLATRHETSIISEAQAPTAPKPDEFESWLAPPKPDWIHRYDFKFIRGGATLSRQPLNDSESLLWVCDKPERPIDFLSLAAISDVFFPRIFIRRQKIGVASTITITTFFHADKSYLSHQGTRPILAAARGQRFYRGYFDQVAELWSYKSELLASSIQMVYFKD